MASLDAVIRSLLIPMSRDQLVLPNVSLAELVSYIEPEKVDGTPDWFLGMIAWRGLRVPLVAFETMIGEQSIAPAANSRIAILNALGGKSKLPFFAILTQGIPHLKQITKGLLSEVSSDVADKPDGVLANILVEAEPAMIPDLDFIESTLLNEQTVARQL
jgi:chemosensory pili system protein ChpC